MAVLIADQFLVYKYRSSDIRYSSELPVLSGRFIKLNEASRLLRPIGMHHEEKQKQRNNKGNPSKNKKKPIQIPKKVFKRSVGVTLKHRVRAELIKGPFGKKGYKTEP